MPSGSRETNTDPQPVLSFWVGMVLQPTEWGIHIQHEAWSRNSPEVCLPGESRSWQVVRQYKPLHIVTENPCSAQWSGDYLSPQHSEGGHHPALHSESLTQTKTTWNRVFVWQLWSDLSYLLKVSTLFKNYFPSKKLVFLNNICFVRKKYADESLKSRNRKYFSRFPDSIVFPESLCAYKGTQNTSALGIWLCANIEAHSALRIWRVHSCQDVSPP